VFSEPWTFNDLHLATPALGEHISRLDAGRSSFLCRASMHSPWLVFLLICACGEFAGDGYGGCTYFHVYEF
jgi:hypothetical protein